MTVSGERTVETVEPSGYPLSWEFDGLLADGEAVLIRPVRPGDARALVAMHMPHFPGAPRRPVLEYPSGARLQ